MQFEIHRETIIKPLQLVSGVVEKRQTMPILGHLLIETNKTGLSFTTTDLEVEMVVNMFLPDAEQGKVTIPARKFLDICKSLPDQENIRFDVKDQFVQISSGRSRFKLAKLPAEDFPVVELGKLENTIKLPVRDLKFLLEQTQFSMAQQDVRYYLNGLLLELDGNTMRTVATDGHRLAWAQLQVEDMDIPDLRQLILPRKGVMEISRLLDDDEGEVTLRFNENHIQITYDQIQFTSKLVDGKFPEYSRVIPEEGQNVVMVDRDLLKQALVRASILSNEKYRGVRFSLQKNKITILANNPEQESAEEEVEVDYQGDEFEIGFNVTYVLDVLNALDEGQVEFLFKDSSSSCLVRKVEEENCKYVVMPMRV